MLGEDPTEVEDIQETEPFIKGISISNPRPANCLPAFPMHLWWFPINTAL
jgi:hypothetical protein